MFVCIAALILLKCSYPKKSTSSKSIIYQNSSSTFYRNKTNNSTVHLEPQKIMNSQIILRKNKARYIITPDFKIYYKATIVKWYFIGKKQGIYTNCTESTEIKTYVYGQLR